MRDKYYINQTSSTLPDYLPHTITDYVPSPGISPLEVQRLGPASPSQLQHPEERAGAEEGGHHRAWHGGVGVEGEDQLAEGEPHSSSGQAQQPCLSHCRSGNNDFRWWVVVVSSNYQIGIKLTVYL